MAKQFGLSFPKKDKGHTIGQVSAIKPKIFDDNSDTEEQPAKPTGLSRGIKKRDIISQEKAVTDDPTVYQYDEVYDEIDKKRNESKLARKDVDKKPKYIKKLLAAAEKRKLENDRRIERQVQKEREEEGDMFKDKESFITPSYKKKLEEMKQQEEQEKREEYLESIGDVKKQGNLDGFYRHLYDQKVNYEGKENEIAVKAEKEAEEEITNDIKEEQVSEDDGKSVSDNHIAEDKSKKVIRKRKYRSRKDSEDSSNNDEEPEGKKEHIQSNIDADSDFSVDSSDSDEESGEKDKKEETINQNETESSPTIKNDVKPTEIATKPEDVKREEDEIKPKKPKIDVWKKRTVGEKFDEAVKRYFERKAIREMGQ